MRVALPALIIALAVPIAAQAQTPGLCAAVWDQLSTALDQIGPTTGTLAASDGKACVIENLRIDSPATYSPDFIVDRLTLSGAALDWWQDGTTPPDRLDLGIDGLRFVVQTGNPQMDYLMAAQANAGGIAVKGALVWSAEARTLAVEKLDIDFPGENRVTLTATAKGVDLSSTGAAQISATSFAVTAVDLTVQSHGLFESYILMMIGPALLPYEGDMQAAEQKLKADAVGAIAVLPDAVVSPASKAALGVLVEEMPNPSGTLTLALRSAAGIGPARLMGYAVTGVPASMDALAPLLDGLTVDIGWTHAPTP
jgi:hypothetical protein